MGATGATRPPGCSGLLSAVALLPAGRRPGFWQNLQFAEASPHGAERIISTPIHGLLLLNDLSFSFSKKQGHKWLVGILPTEVWASDWIPHRLGAEWELGAC